MRVVFAGSRRGFTLIDVLGALLIIGVGVAAVMHFIARSTAANASSGRLGVATVLANNIHEYALSLDPSVLPQSLPTPPAYLLQLDGKTFNPPIDGQGDSITDMADPATGKSLWSQAATVVAVSRGKLGSGVSQQNPVTPTSTNLRRLTVVVSYNNKPVYSATWMVSPSFAQP